MFSREWCMPDCQTFNMKPVRNLFKKYIKPNDLWIDPMSGKFSPANIKNDLNTENLADFHLDATEFLKTYGDNSIYGILFDPPYSSRQVAECYRELGLTVNMETTQGSYWSKIKREIGRVIKPGGVCISFGWNSNGIGKQYGFEIVEILLIAHGGVHNDTICIVEKKTPNMFDSVYCNGVVDLPKHSNN